MTDMLSYQEYYQSIVKPFFAPPEWTFGLAWGIIYPLIAVAFIYLVILISRRRVPIWLFGVFALNVVSNFLFTPLQLGYPDTVYATLDIFVVLGTLAVFEWNIWRHSRIIFWLLAPYLLWGTFATVLQVTIFAIN